MNQTEIERLVVRFTVENREYIADLQRTVQATQREMEQMKRAMESVGNTNTLFQQIIANGRTLLALFGVGFGLQQFKHYAEVAYRAFDNFITAQRGLRTVLQANHRDVQTTLASYNEYAIAVSHTTTNTQLATLSLLKLAEGYKLTGDSAKAAVHEAQALAEFTGRSPEQLMRITTAFQKGNYEEAHAMSRMLPELRHIKDEVQMVNAYNSLVEAGMKAQAEHAETVSGRWEIIKNRMNEAAIVLGEKMNPVLGGWVNILERVDFNTAGGDALTGGMWSKIFPSPAAVAERANEVLDEAARVKAGLGQFVLDVTSEINKLGLSEHEQRLGTFGRLGGDISGGVAALRQRERAEYMSHFREMLDLKNTLSAQDRATSMIRPNALGFESFDPSKAKTGMLADIANQTQKLSNQWQGLFLVNEQFERMVRTLGKTDQADRNVTKMREFIADQMAIQEGLKVKLDVMTPQEKLDYELEKLFELLRRGAITWDEYGKAANKARNEILGATAAITAANFAGSNAARVSAWESMQKVRGTFSPHVLGGPPPLPPGAVMPQADFAKFVNFPQITERAPMPRVMPEAMPNPNVVAPAAMLAMAGVAQALGLNAGGGFKAPVRPQIPDFVNQPVPNFLERLVVRGIPALTHGEQPKSMEEMRQAADTLKSASVALQAAAKFLTTPGGGIQPANLK